MLAAGGGSGVVPLALYQRKVPFEDYAGETSSSWTVNQVLSHIRAVVQIVSETGVASAACVSWCLRVSRGSPGSLQSAHLLSSLGVRLMAGRQYSDAEKLLRRGFCIAAARLGASHVEMMFSLDWLGQALFLQGKNKEALLVCLAAKRIVVDELGEYHPNMCGCLLNLAAIYDAEGWFMCAMQMREQATHVYASISLASR